MVINYKHNSLLSKDVETEYFGLNIITKIINGYIYRGDEHNALVLSKSPKFYGTKESAMEYIVDGEYLKRYRTIGKIRLLNITAGQNTENIINLFKNYLIGHNLLKHLQIDIKISYIIIQAMFGLSKDGTIDKAGLADDDIIKYFKKQKIIDANTKIFMKIINNIIKRTIPSRCSIRPIDQLLMMNLRDILSFMKIDGIYYINTNTTGKNLLCKTIDKYYGENADTCTPTEICIFDPANKLGGVVMWKKTHNNLILIDKKSKYSRYIKNNYNRLSINDLYTLTTKKKSME